MSDQRTTAVVLGVIAGCLVGAAWLRAKARREEEERRRDFPERLHREAIARMDARMEEIRRESQARLDAYYAHRRQMGLGLTIPIHPFEDLVRARQEAIDENIHSTQVR